MDGQIQTSPGGRLEQAVLPLAILVAVLASAAIGSGAQSARERLDRARLEARIDRHVGDLSRHLAAREALARAVAAVYRPRPGGLDGGLDAVDPRLLLYAGDVFSFVWIPTIPPDRQGEALAVLARKRPGPQFFLTAGRRPLAPAEIAGRTLMPVMDIIPRTEPNIRSLGLDLASLPAPRAALRHADDNATIAMTAPINLVQVPGEKAVVVYVPVRGSGGADTIGHVGFSYLTENLLQGLQPEALRGLGVEVRDPDGEISVIHRSDSFVPQQIVGRRELRFGGRRWQLAFSSPGTELAAARDLGIRAGLAALLAFGLVIAGLAVLLRRNRQLGAALQAQRVAEDRLQVVIGELSHRIRNVFTLAQTIAAQTFRPIDRDGTHGAAFAGRMRAMAAAADLLAAGDAGSATLADIAAGSHLPCREQVTAGGPPLLLSSRGAQSFHMLIHELWTNAAKHGALAEPAGRVTIGWHVEDDWLVFDWQETGANVPGPLPERRGFGRDLIERLVPRQLRGTATLTMTPAGLAYRLRVPRVACEAV